MKKLLILLLALLVIAAIAYFCVYQKHAPAIQTDIQTRVQAALGSQGLSSIDATVDGRDITLTGIASSQEMRQLAEQTAQVDGYNLINNQIQAPGDEGGLADSMPRNHSLGIALDEKGIIVIDGILDADSHQALRAAAIARYGEANVQDRILDLDIPVADGMPDVAIATLEKLGDLTSGDVVIVGNKVGIKGSGASKAILSQIEEQLKEKMPKGYELNLDLAVVEVASNESPKPATEASEPTTGSSSPAATEKSEPAAGKSNPVGQSVIATMPVIAKKVQPVVPASTAKAKGQNKKASVAAVKRCQRQFNRILRKSKVRFNSSSATIKRSSHRTLNRLATVAKKCTGMKISIHGHTDSTGRNKLNKRLSKKRARRIVSYLANKGIPTKHLVSIGHGSSRPVASNKTRQGRARNRRIEFTVESIK